MNQLVRGNTVREAYNALFNSPEWEAFRTNPMTTWDPSVVDLPSSEQRKRIGPALIQAIKEHYADMAAMQFELSGSEASKQWRKDVELFRNTEEQSDALIDALETVLP